MRTAGRTVRLYTNGVFHSQYNPTRVFGGSLWDLLSLPALMQPASSDARVLVLGVGGGAVIRQLTSLMNNPKIFGVDLDPVHLLVARRWFNTDLPESQLIHADAQEWLSNYQGPPFDLIVEDVFTDEQGEPVRAIPLDKRWIATLKRHVGPGGMLIINQLSRTDARRKNPLFSDTFDQSWSLQHPRYHNCVVAHLRFSFKLQGLYDRLDEHPGLSSFDKRVAKNVELKKILTR